MALHIEIIGQTVIGRNKFELHRLILRVKWLRWFGVHGDGSYHYHTTFLTRTFMPLFQYNTISIDNCIDEAISLGRHSVGNSSILLISQKKSQ
jgi:hypothetical protein